MTNDFMKLAAHVEMVDVDFGAVLLDRRSGTYWELNEMGTTVVHLGISAVPRDVIVDSIRSSYDVGSEQVDADIDTLVAALREAGLVVGAIP